MKNVTKTVGFIILVAIIGFSMAACGDGADVSGETGGGTALDGTWLKSDTSFQIEFSGTNWVVKVSGAEQYKGTWSSTSTITAPSSGTITIAITHNGGTPITSENTGTYTEDVTYELNAAGDELTLSITSSEPMWQQLIGTYNKQGGGKTEVTLGIPTLAINTGTKTASWNAVPNAKSTEGYTIKIDSNETPVTGTNFSLASLGEGTHQISVKTNGYETATYKYNDSAYCTPKPYIVSGETGGGTALDGAWLKSDGSFQIEFTGTNWVVKVSGNEQYKGTWSSASAITAPSTGTITIAITHVGGNPITPENIGTYTEGATYGLNASGDALTLGITSSEAMWLQLVGTYNKQGGGGSHDGTPGLDFEAIGSPATAYRVRKGTVTSGAVVIPATYNGLPVTTIGGTDDNTASAGAFYNSGIDSITIPASVMTIYQYAFYDCTSLTSVTFIGSSQLTYIGIRAFRNCSSLSSINIPANVTMIGEDAFNSCTNLASVTFATGSQLQAIQGQAFRSTKLTGITIPASVTTIEEYALAGCTNLTSVTFAGSAIGSIYFGSSVFPEGSSNGNALKTAYQTGGAGTYTRDSGGSTWTKQGGGGGGNAGTYIITGSGTEFTATHNGVTVEGANNQPLIYVTYAIQLDAGDNDCTIQFGNGTDVLDIGSAGIIFTEGGEITLSGKITTTNSISIYNDVSVISTADITNTGAGNNGRVFVISGGTLTVDSGTILSKSSDAIFISSTSEGTVTINGGTVSTESTEGANSAVRNSTNGNVFITGGTISATSATGWTAISNSGTGKVNISGGTISAERYATINNSGTGEIVITGGIFSNSFEEGTGATIYNGGSGATITISDGTFIATGSYSKTIYNEGTMLISGGTVSNTGQNGTVVYNNENGTLTINGGMISATGTGVSAYAVYNSGGTVTIGPGATINGNQYGVN